MATSRAQTSSGRKRPYAPRLPPAERREQLLDAALDLIAEDGYRGVSMEAIARRAGVTKPVVYDLFSNRGELLMALLEREEENALALLAEVMPSAPSVDPDELIVEGFRAFLESVATNPTTWRLIVLPADGTPEVVRQHVEAGRATVRARLADLLRAAARRALTRSSRPKPSRRSASTSRGS
jgi:AcrR family transcriptional regulator